MLISYENEAITAQKAGVDLDYVIPDQTILIQNPAAVTKESKRPSKAKAFLDWLKTPEAQKIYASKGYRSVLARPGRQDARTRRRRSCSRSTSSAAGTRSTTSSSTPRQGSVAEIEQDLGVSTAK